MLFNEFLAQQEAESRSFFTAGSFPGMHLIQFEEVGQGFLTYPEAVVLDGNLNKVSILDGGNAHRSRTIRELDGIGKQIAKDGVQHGLVG